MNDKTTVSDLCNAQVMYCNARGLPVFIPRDGYCWNCGENIFDKKYGYNQGDASKCHLTRCPHCLKSFCD